MLSNKNAIITGAARESVGRLQGVRSKGAVALIYGGNKEAAQETVAELEKMELKPWLINVTSVPLRKLKKQWRRSLKTSLT